MNTPTPHGSLEQHWDGIQLLALFQGAATWLEQQVARINALNVFPVPDGDTGTNMNLTLSAALKKVNPHSSVGEIARLVSTGAMYGARGNSGVILSQILRGMAHALAGHDLCDPALLVEALVEGSRTAYRGASEPREGTILTVSREAAEAAKAALQAESTSLEKVLAAAVAGARASVDRTPDLLEVLRKAGVVDAGGEGYFVVLEGMLRTLRGDSLEYISHSGEQEQFATVEDDGPHEGFGFCTNVLLSGENLAFDEIRAHMQSVGESVVVVGDTELIRIHIHTPRPGDILNYLVERGTITQVEIANMDLQREAIKQQQTAQQKVLPGVVYPSDRSHSTPYGTVVVAPGKGFVELFLGLQADAVVLGGQTMNPSTQDILEAIEAIPQNEIVVLPNNGNVIRSAEEARRLSQKTIHVVPTRTVPQGISALLGRNLQLDFAAYTAAMERAMGNVTTIEITKAVRDADFDGVVVRAGQIIALLDGKLALADDQQDRLIDAILAQAKLDEHDVLTLYYGQQVTLEEAEALAERLRQAYPDQEIEVQAGDQPHYDYIMGIE